MKNVYVVEAARTAVARGGKQSWFMNVRADELSSIVMKELRERIGVGEDWAKQDEIIDDVVWATCANAYKEQGGNFGRIAWLQSGGSYNVAGCTVDRLCASSLSAIAMGMSTMQTFGGDVIFAGGGQHMTHIPMGAGFDVHPDAAKFMDPMSLSMGWTSEQVARRFNIGRERMDAFSLKAHQKCAAAQDANGGLGKTKDVIIPIQAKVPVKGYREDPLTPAAKFVASEHLAKKYVEDGGEVKEMVVFRDQGLRRDTSLEGLAKMKPVFMQDEAASVTAGNSSQINDAGAGVVLATDEGCKKIGKKPIMKLHSYAVIGVEPMIMGVGPAYAIPKVMKRSGLDKKDIGLWEVNEAFASQALYCCEDVLDLPMDRVNVWGSGIAIGHPLACTGARIACDVTQMFLDPEFADVKYIVESMCVGGGMGAAAIWERA
ncbi:MAG: thiolase family protein [Bacillota bacterium]|nr:thiolase family protein [Bacillota bacterium]